MRKVVLLIAVLLMAVPAMAASEVVITATDDDVNCVTITYFSDVNLIRAFGLAIEVNDANIVKVDSADPCYRIYPGQIIIEDGEITDYNNPYPEGDLGDANLAIEMGSLYTMDSNYAGDPNAGYNMKPTSSGTLLKFYVDGDCTYTVAEDTLTGGIVMEDPCQPIDVNIAIVDGVIPTINDCMADTNPDKPTWQAWGEPNCWCYERQCNGDVDGKKQLLYWVSTNDYAVLKAAYNKTDGILQGIPNGICADFDHAKQLLYRVSSNDFNILKLYYNVISVPSCGSPPDSNFNFWIVP